MKDKTSCSNANWDFFSQVAAAAFANPFGERRDELDALIGGVSNGTPPERALAAVLAKVDESVTQLMRSGQADLRQVESERREVLRGVFCFHVFHRYQDQFDRLILDQLKQGDTPCRVSFAKEALSELTAFGLGQEESLRVFSFFYQLRRAFFFIRNGLVGTSPAMRTLRKHLWNCVFTHDIRLFESRLWNRMEDFSVLLLGETGTGKGAAAAAIGRSGFIPFDPVRNSFTESFTRNFVSINLSQYSEGVLESELFGHRKGAFTGAVENHEGLFSRCAPHGVIFLDEIGDVSIPVQIKLLQVVQERVFYPVGSHEVKRFSGRVIAATNRPLDELILEGTFRDDLYYRLCSDVVRLPPLAKRVQEDPAELDCLLESILTRIAGGSSGREKQVIRKVLNHELGPEYPWPGNVRELEQAVKRIILTGHYHGMKKPAGKQDDAARLTQGMQEGVLDAESLLAGYCTLLYRRFGTYEEVSRRAQLDRRTAKKYVQMGLNGADEPIAG